MRCPPHMQLMIEPSEATRETCPICGKPAERNTRPFCSRRCANIDLNRWLSGVYAVPVREAEDEDGTKPAGHGEDDR